jgi:hypothetical protein
MTSILVFVVGVVAGAVAGALATMYAARRGWYEVKRVDR